MRIVPTVIALTLLTACPADEADKGTSLSAGPGAGGETGTAPEAPKPPAAGEPVPEEPPVACVDELAKALADLEACKSGK